MVPNSWAGELLNYYGPTNKKLIISPFAKGIDILVCLTEPGAGSDAPPFNPRHSS
jgi:hypothetical protein